MAIDVGGIRFTVTANVGRSAQSIAKVTKAVKDLKSASDGLQGAQANIDGLSKQTGKTSQAVAKQSAEAKKSAQSAARSTAATRQHSQALRQQSQQASRAASSNRQLADSYRAVLEGIAALGLSRLITSSTLLAGRVKNLNTVLRNTANIANFSGGEVSAYEAHVKDLGITTQVARTILTRFAQNNLDLADSIRISRIAQDAAVVAGTNSSAATEKLTIAIQRLDTEMLRNLGITVNLRQEYQAVALATGRVETSLTAQEKQQIVLNAVIRQGAALAGNYEAAMGDVFKQFTSLDRKMEEAAKTLGQQYLPIFGAAVKATDTFLDFQANKAPNALLTFEASVLSASAVLAGLATATSVAKFASVSYKRTVQGMTAAQIANAAANRASIFSLQGLKAAYASTVAFVRAHPLIVGATILAGAAAAVSSLRQQREARRKEEIEQARTDVVLTEDTRNLAKRIRELGDEHNRTARQQDLLNDAQREAIRLNKEHEQALLSLIERPAEFAAKLEEIRPEINVDQLKADIRELEQIKKQRDERRKKARERRAQDPESLRIPTPRPVPIAEVNVDRKLAVKQAELAEAESLAVNRALRVLDQQDRNAEIALQLAQRAKSRLESGLIKSSGSESLASLKTLEQFEKGLSRGFESLETIDRRAKTETKKAELERDKRIKQAKDLTELEKIRADFTKRTATIEAKRESDLRRREDTLESFKALEKLSSIQLFEQTREVDQFKRRLQLLAQDVAPEVITALDALDKVITQTALTDKLAAESIAAHNHELGRLQQALKTASPEEKEAIQRQITATMQSRKLAQATREHNAELADAKKAEVFRGVVEQNTEATKELKQEAEETAAEIDKLNRSMALIGVDGSGAIDTLDTLDDIAGESRARVAELEAQLSALRAELKAIAAAGTPGNKALRSIQRRIAALKAEKALTLELAAARSDTATAAGIADIEAKRLATGRTAADIREDEALAGLGVPKNLIQQRRKLADLHREAKQEQEAFLKEIEALKDEETRLEKEGGEKRLEAARELLKEMEALRDAARAETLAKERAFNREYRDEVKDGFEGARDAAESSLRSLRDAVENTQDFIVNKRFELFGERFVGESDLFGASKSFRGAIRGAGSPDQVEQVLRLAQAQLQIMLRQLQVGAPGQAPAFQREAANVFKQLQAEAADRKRLLARENMKFQLQVKQVELLGRILGELRAAAGKKAPKDPVAAAGAGLRARAARGGAAPPAKRERPKTLLEARAERRKAFEEEKERRRKAFADERKRKRERAGLAERDEDVAERRRRARSPEAIERRADIARGISDGVTTDAERRAARIAKGGGDPDSERAKRAERIAGLRAMDSPDESAAFLRSLEAEALRAARERDGVTDPLSNAVRNAEVGRGLGGAGFGASAQASTTPFDGGIGDSLVSAQAAQSGVNGSVNRLGQTLNKGLTGLTTGLNEQKQLLDGISDQVASVTGRLDQENVRGKRALQGKGLTTA